MGCTRSQKKFPLAGGARQGELLCFMRLWRLLDDSLSDADRDHNDAHAGGQRQHDPQEQMAAVARHGGGLCVPELTLMLTVAALVAFSVSIQ